MIYTYIIAYHIISYMYRCIMYCALSLVCSHVLAHIHDLMYVLIRVRKFAYGPLPCFALMFKTN